MAQERLAAYVKRNFPKFSNIDDDELERAIIAKYPQYKNFGGEPEQKSKWGDYTAMGLRGVAGFAPPGPVGSLVAGAADLVGQGLEMVGGSRKKFNPLQLGTEATLGAAGFLKHAKNATKVAKVVKTGLRGSAMAEASHIAGELGDGRELTPKGMITAATIGGVAGGTLQGVANKFGKVGAPDIPTTKVAESASDEVRQLGPGRITDESRLLGPKVEQPSFIGTPKGQVATADDNTDILNALNAERPGTGLTVFEQLPRSDVARLEGKAVEPLTTRPKELDVPSRLQRGRYLSGVTRDETAYPFNLAPDSVKYGPLGRFRQEDFAPDSVVFEPSLKVDPMGEAYKSMADRLARQEGGEVPRYNKLQDPSEPGPVKPISEEAREADKIIREQRKAEFKGKKKPEGSVTTEFTQPGPGRTKVEKAKEVIAEAVEKKKDKTDGLINPEFVASDVQTQWRGSRKFMESVPELKKLTDQWIKLRDAAKVEAQKIKYDFQQHIGKYGKQDLIAFQDEMAKGGFSHVRKYFEDKFNWLKANDVVMRQKDNYLPQLFENSEEEVAKAFARTGFNKKISTTAPFEYRSVYKDYAEALAAHPELRPRYSPMELIQWYERTANQLVADRNYFNALKAGGYIRPSIEKIGEETVTAPKNWVSIDPDLVPKVFSKGREIVWKTDPRFRTALENYLAHPDDFIEKLAQTGGALKSVALSSGLPWTGANSYGIITAKRAAQEGGLKRLGTAFRFMFNPRSAQQYLEDNRDDMVKWAREGLTFGHTDDQSLGAIFKNDGAGKLKQGVNWIVDKQKELFERPLFEQMIPALKLASVEANYAKLVNAGLSDAVAKRQAVEFVNQQYSSLNYNLLYRNKQIQNLSRLAFISPSLLESNYKIGKGMAAALLKPGSEENKIYHAMIGRTMAAYMAANAINMMNTGHPMYENKPGREFDIAIGIDPETGDERYFRLFGSESDLIKIPVQTALSLIGSGSISGLTTALENKASLMIRPVLDAIKNRDGRGSYNVAAFQGRDQYGREIPWRDRAASTVNSIAQSTTPQLLQAAVGLATGKGLEQSIADVSEFPIVYSKTGERNKKKNPPPLKFNFLR